MSVRTPQACRHCGEVFQPGPRGRVPLYCSKKCRRNGCVRVGRCVECACEIVRRNGDQLPERCYGCNQAARRERYASSERRAEVLRLYRAGVPLKDIAQRLGYANEHSVQTVIWRCRTLYGVEVPHRYRMRDGRRAAA